MDGGGTAGAETTASARRVRRRPRVGILFSQFAAYHVDRCEAAAALLGNRAEVVAVEVATASTAYAWEPSGEVRGADKRVLFPGRRFEEIGRWRRFRAEFAALRGCDVVFIGVGYNEPDVIALAFALRATGRRVVVMSESKFDDRPRALFRETLKRIALLAYDAALVGGTRHVAYMLFLGFRRRPVLTGYDAVSLDRVRAEGGVPGPLAQRPFVFVGRFVAKKNLALLIEAYALYLARAGEHARSLALVGGGELEAELHARIATAGLDDRVAITGFLPAPDVARMLSGGFALILPSVEEQWGLVVNEALAFGLPVLASEAVGARETLVHNLVNGFVLPPDDAAAWAKAMLALDRDEELHQRMAAASHRLAPLGDAARFAEAVAALVFS